MAKVTNKEARKLASQLKISKSIPLKEFKAGVKVEKEHGPVKKGGVSNKTNVTGGNLKKTGKIALAHLKESPIYYKELHKMEKKLEKTKRKKSK